MKRPLTPQELSGFFKDVFLTDEGQVVLEKLKSFCGGNPQEVLAVPASTNQTFFNLGANSVYRFIQRQINMESSELTSDCVIEKNEDIKY